MDMMDAKIAAAEARVDTKFEQLRGDLAGFSTRITSIQSAIDGKPGFWNMVGIIAGGIATALAIGLAVIAFGGDRFDAGMGLADKQAAQMQRDTKQDKDVAAINQKLDKLIEQSQKK